MFEEQLKDAMLSSWFQLMITHNMNVKNNKGWNPVLLLQHRAGTGYKEACDAFSIKKGPESGQNKSWRTRKGH